MSSFQTTTTTTSDFSSSSSCSPNVIQSLFPPPPPPPPTTQIPDCSATFTAIVSSSPPPPPSSSPCTPPLLPLSFIGAPIDETIEEARPSLQKRRKQNDDIYSFKEAVIKKERGETREGYEGVVEEQRNRGFLRLSSDATTLSLSQQVIEMLAIPPCLPDLFYYAVPFIQKPVYGNVIHKYGAWSHLAHACPWFSLRLGLATYNFFPYKLNTNRFRVINGTLVWPHFSSFCYSSFTFPNEMYIMENGIDIAKIVFHPTKIELFEKVNNFSNDIF